MEKKLVISLFCVHVAGHGKSLQGLLKLFPGAIKAVLFTNAEVSLTTNYLQPNLACSTEFLNGIILTEKQNVGDFRVRLLTCVKNVGKNIGNNVRETLMKPSNLLVTCNERFTN